MLNVLELGVVEVGESIRSGCCSLSKMITLDTKGAAKISSWRSLEKPFLSCAFHLNCVDRDLVLILSWEEVWLDAGPSRPLKVLIPPVLNCVASRKDCLNIISPATDADSW